LEAWAVPCVGAERGRSSEAIADTTGHKSLATVAIYRRRVDAFDGNAGEGLL